MISLEMRKYYDARSWFQQKKGKAPLAVFEILKTKLEKSLSEATLKEEKESLQELIYDLEIELETRKDEIPIQDKRRLLPVCSEMKPMVIEPSILILVSDFKVTNLWRKVERELVLVLMKHFENNRGVVARTMGISYRTLTKLISDYEKGIVKDPMKKRGRHVTKLEEAQS
jgi:DNA-binding NtrC family response regulator